MKRIFAAALVLAGVVLAVVGAANYRAATQPQVCEGDFVHSLGGKSTLEFERLRQRQAQHGVIELAGGVLLAAGGVLLARRKSAWDELPLDEEKE